MAVRPRIFQGMMLPVVFAHLRGQCLATAAVLTAVALGSGACDRVRAAVGAAPALHGAAYTTAETAPPLRLPRARAVGTIAGASDTFDLARDARRRAVLVFFGYTHCPDVCPTTLADWSRVRRTIAARDAADTARVRFVFVTVDPERDSAAVVAHYVAQFDPSFVGLTGSRAAVDAAQRAWHVSSFRDAPSAGAPAGSYTVSHAAQVFLVGPDGRLRTIYPLGVPIADVVTDMQTVLAGG